MWWPRLSRQGQLLLAGDRRRCFWRPSIAALTRSVWMGGILAVALAVGLALPWSWRLPLLVGGVLAGACWWWPRSGSNLLAFKRDKALSAEKTAESVELRPIMAVVAWHMFLDRPLLGCGYAQYGTEHRNYLSDRSTDLPLERVRDYIPHNVVLSLLTETGLVGLGLFLAMVFFWTRDAWRLWSDAACRSGHGKQGC